MKTIVLKMHLFGMKREARWRAVESKMAIRTLRDLRSQLKGALHCTNVAFAERGPLRGDCDKAIDLYRQAMSKLAAVSRSREYMEAHKEYVAARNLLDKADALNSAIKQKAASARKQSRSYSQV